MQGQRDGRDASGCRHGYPRQEGKAQEQVALFVAAMPIPACRGLAENPRFQPHWCYIFLRAVKLHQRWRGNATFAKAYRAARKPDPHWKRRKRKNHYN